MAIIEFTSLYIPISVDKGNLLDWSRLSPVFIYVYMYWLLRRDSNRIYEGTIYGRRKDGDRLENRNCLYICYGFQRKWILLASNSLQFENSLVQFRTIPYNLRTVLCNSAQFLAIWEQFGAIPHNSLQFENSFVQFRTIPFVILFIIILCWYFVDKLNQFKYDFQGHFFP